MGKVNLLPPEIISKIAAGEVIERPASVIKELVENSLDAKATSIAVVVKDAGKSLISIKDNGTGIEHDDIEKLFVRHSTSKINKIDDLYSIQSLGFRGEALYSIASISDVTLRSKTKQSDSGWEIHIRGGEKISLKPVSMQNGTEIEVKELFFNTPARRKFLKTDSAELNQIISTFTPYALFSPEIEFKLTHNNRELISLAIEKYNSFRIASALHLKVENLIETFKKQEDGLISMRLFLGDINIQRIRKDMQYVFVNGRPVQDKTIGFHLNQVYRLIMPPEVYPAFIAFINIPCENIDVNTHPTKREIKIKDERALVEIIRPLAENALISMGHTKKLKEPWVDDKKNSPLDQPIRKYVDDKIDLTPLKDMKNHSPKDNRLDENIEPVKQYALYTNRQNNLDSIFIETKNDMPLKDKLKAAKYIGPFMKKYLIFESGQSLLLIDQHAAQERVTFEKLLSQISSKKLEVQKLLAPIVILLSTEEIVLWNENKIKLEEFGFTTTGWDKESIAIHSHPQLINKPEIAVRNILLGGDTVFYNTETFARLACRSSIMAGDDVSRDFASYLRDQLLACKDPFTCPHGRPTVIEIEEKFISKQFLR